MSDRIIKRSVSKTGKLLPIGRTGENMFRTVAIDTSGWALEDAECRVIYSRPDGLTYPVETTYKDGCVIWTPTAYDLEIGGNGQVEVRAYLGDSIGKSATFKVRIEESMHATEAQPGIARPDWVDDIIDKVVISDMTQTVASTESGGINVFTVTLTNGESADFEVRNGAKGDKGDTGAKGDTGNTGADGYTPQRGVDYWTEEDKTETVTAVLEEAESSMDTKLGGYVKKSDFSAAKGIIMVSSVSSAGTTYTPTINMATTTEIKALAHKYKPIVPANLETAVSYVNSKNGMATKTYVDNAVSEVEEKIPDVSGFVTTEELNTALGDIEAALDSVIASQESILAMQNALIGGEAY